MARVHPSDPHVTHRFQLFEIIDDVSLWGSRSCVSPTWIRFHLSDMLQEAQRGSLRDAVTPAVELGQHSNPSFVVFEREVKGDEQLGGWGGAFRLSDACVYVKNSVQRVERGKKRSLASCFTTSK